LGNKKGAKMKKLLTLLTLGILSFSVNVNAKSDVYKEINAEELQKMQKENAKLAVIDSRGGDWFDGTVIQGAVQLAASDTNEENLAKISADKNAPIVFYCTNEQCPASAKAAHKAAELGYKNIFKYKAGIDDWKKRGLPTATVAKNG
jgi:rhodanese-related sulfurtransferase